VHSASCWPIPYLHSTALSKSSWLVSWPTRAEVGPIEWHSETAVDTDHAIMILDCAYVTQEHLWHQITMTTEAIVIFYLAILAGVSTSIKLLNFLLVNIS
jgi:hypothetical protein